MYDTVCEYEISKHFIELQRMHHNISTNSITKNAYEKSEEQLKNHVKLPCFILAYTPRCSLKF